MLRLTCFALAVSLLTACASQNSPSSASQENRVAAPNQAYKENDFASEVRGKIRSQLSYANIDNLPGSAEVKVTVSLALDGQVTQTTLVHSSGYPAYDQAVVNAVLRASPLPAPATESERELAITFRPREAGPPATVPPLLPAGQQTATLEIPQILEVGRPEESQPMHCNFPAPAYPAEAKRARQQGAVAVRVFISPDGTLEKSVVEKSSGYPALDRAALRASRQIVCRAPHQRVTLLQPFQFNLEKSRYVGGYDRQLIDRIRHYLVLDHVKPLPDTVATKVSVLVAPDGQITQSTLIQSSGDPAYDSAVLQALAKASPMPEGPQAGHRRFTLTFGPGDAIISSTQQLAPPEEQETGTR